MKQIAFLSIATLAVTIASSGAYALSNRTFVSGTGNDANPCSLGAPCRSFTGALAQTNPGGEIAVLDTAGYGSVTIGQAVSIVNEEGVEAGITVTTGDGITINAGVSDVVNLRGLTIVGAGGGNGVTFNSGRALNIQNCVIRGLGTHALNLIPTTTADINISNTIVSGNTSDGVHLAPSGTSLTVTASFEQVQAIHNGGNAFIVFGTLMTGTLHAIAADSLASGNGFGFVAASLSGQAAADFVLAGSRAANNQVGLSSGNNAVLFLNGTTVAGNINTGFQILGTAAIASYGNNAITDTSNIGSLTPVALR
jgi:hypothetical protein